MRVGQGTGPGPRGATPSREDLEVSSHCPTQGTTLSRTERSLLLSLIYQKLALQGACRLIPFTLGGKKRPQWQS